VSLGPALQRVRVWQVLLLAFVARLGVGLANDGVLYPDEVMQYLEQAHRLVFGAGMVPWEYEHGVRSWVVPLVLAGPLRLLALLGLDTPAVYQPVIKAALSLARNRERWQGLVGACAGLAEPFYDRRYGLTEALAEILCPEISDYAEPPGDPTAVASK